MDNKVLLKEIRVHLTLFNKVLFKEIRVHLTLFEQLTYKLNIFNDLTDLTNSITFFI